MLTIACVRVGDKYSADYVYRLKRGVARGLLDYRHEFVCITDKPKELPGISAADISFDMPLPGWWSKMLLLAPMWRRGRRVIYFDLDTVIAGDLSPLADLQCDFGICANFTRRAGVKDYPCRYGSCVMTLAPDWGTEVWKRFITDCAPLIARAGQYGDQKAIEELVPNATLLQDALPRGFFLGYRDLPAYRTAPPKGCSVVVFAGSQKPDNTDCAWARRAWAA